MDQMPVSLEATDGCKVVNRHRRSARPTSLSVSVDGLVLEECSQWQVSTPGLSWMKNINKIVEIKMMIWAIIDRTTPKLDGDYRIVDPLNITSVPPEGRIVLEKYID